MAMKLHPKPLSVLIIGPRISMAVWEREIDRHYRWRALVENFTEQWGSENWKHPRYMNCYIRNTHFFLAGREETFRRGRTEDGDILRPKQDELEAWNPDVIVVDESHEFQRPGGVGAQDLWRMVRRLRKKRGDGMPYVILLSGTPNPRGWRSLFAQFRIMDDSILGTAVADFDEDYVVYGKGKRKYKILRYRNESRLRRLRDDHSVSVSAEEAGLAGVTSWEKVPVILPPKAKRLYLEMANELITEMESGTVIDAANPGVRRIRLLQILGGFTTEGELIHDARVRALKEYVHRLVQLEESLLIYARFVHEVDACYDAMKKLGVVAHRVYGATKQADRRLAFDALATRPSVPTVICFQYQAGSRAIDLSGAAETIYYSTPDGWVDYWQTVKRTQGPNQKRPVRYTHLYSPGTVEVGQIRNLQQKEDWHAEMMKNPKRYLFGL
jgi:hypothetical protein